MKADTFIDTFDLDAATLDFYRTVMQTLDAAQMPFLVGGSHALVTHTNMPRRSKDLDLFVLPENVPLVLDTLARAGFRTELTFTHWLGKAYSGEQYIDIIFNSGNGLCRVDDAWFRHALDGMVLGMNVKLCPLEESIWQKAFIMERHRYDGADVAHLLRASGGQLDWQRLLARFGDHWRVLLSHLVLFSYIYPADEDLIPHSVRSELLSRHLQETADPQTHGICGGTNLSSVQYQGDLEQEGLADGRLQPRGPLTQQQITEWTTSIEKQNASALEQSRS